MRAGTLQSSCCCTEKSARQQAGPERECVRGPLAASRRSLCNGPHRLNFPPGCAVHCSDLAVRLQGQQDSSRLTPTPRSYHQTTSLFTAPQSKDFARIFANLPACRQIWSRAESDLKGVEASLVWGFDRHTLYWLLGLEGNS